MLWCRCLKVMLTWLSVLIREQQRTPEWTLAPPLARTENAFWLVSWEAVTACHWSVSILLISRERIVWEAVNIFDIKPWNMFLFQFSFRPPPSASCSLSMFQFQSHFNTMIQLSAPPVTSRTSEQDELQHRPRTRMNQNQDQDGQNQNLLLCFILHVVTFQFNQSRHYFFVL